MRKMILLFGLSIFMISMAQAQGPDVDVVDIAINSEAHTTLVAAVKAGELVETLKSDGPFTVFAPTNEAFAALPEGTVETLLKKENIKTLQAVLTYHVVAGNIDSKAVVKAIKKGNGEAKLTTVQGEELTAYMDGKKVFIKDANGRVAQVTAVDLKAKNGVVHVLNQVILPKQ